MAGRRDDGEGTCAASKLLRPFARPAICKREKEGPRRETRGRAGVSLLDLHGLGHMDCRRQDLRPISPKIFLPAPSRRSRGASWHHGTNLRPPTLHPWPASARRTQAKVSRPKHACVPEPKGDRRCLPSAIPDVRTCASVRLRIPGRHGQAQRRSGICSEACFQGRRCGRVEKAQRTRFSGRMRWWWADAPSRVPHGDETIGNLGLSCRTKPWPLPLDTDAAGDLRLACVRQDYCRGKGRP